MAVNLKSRLSALGLNRKEVDLYLAVLQYGKHPTSFFAKKVNLNRGTAYNALHALLQRGLISKSTQQGVQYFSPLDPAHLLNGLEREEAELLERRKIAREIIPELEAISPEPSLRPSMQYFTGPDGVRAALKDTIEAKEKTLRAFSSSLDMDEILGDYFGGTYTDERIKRGYTLLSIQSYEKDRRVLERPDYEERYGPSKESHRQVRYARSELVFPMSMYIYDNKVLVISSKEENFALLTTSKEYCEMQKKIFYEIWNSLDPTDG